MGCGVRGVRSGIGSALLWVESSGTLVLDLEVGFQVRGWGFGFKFEGISVRTPPRTTIGP